MEGSISSLASRAYNWVSNKLEKADQKLASNKAIQTAAVAYKDFCGGVDTYNQNAGPYLQVISPICIPLDIAQAIPE